MSDFLLKEDGDKLLQEDDDFILLVVTNPVEAFRRLWTRRARRLFNFPAYPRRR